MKTLKTFACLASISLFLAAVVAVAAPASAEEGGTADAPAMGTIGPGAPPAGGAKPAAPASKKAPPKSAAKGIALSPMTPVSPAVNVHQKTLDECRLQTLLPQLIAERNSEVVLTDGGGATKLELKIVDVHAPSGGWFSGPKWITVEGRLLQGKTVKGSFVAKETSMASATACGMLSKVMTVLAGDIATWLQNPTKDARLGSAR